ncbi:MAG: glycosyltransferase family 4 protein [Candidatus Eisenbacteria sp.]|nr:glycosyltransferase family 4 protein [Candidatus Eisenbacteria bacterium]
MRVLHIGLLRFASAISWHAVMMAKALQERGHFCWVAGHPGSPLVALAAREGLQVPAALGFPELRPWNWGHVVGKLRRFLIDQRVDRLIVHTGSGHLEAHLARRGLGIPLVRVRADARVPRADLPHRWLYLHGCDRLVVSGAYMLDRHLAPIGISRERVSVLPPGIDLSETTWRPDAGRQQAREDIRHQYQIPGGVPLFGVIGRLSPVKGHQTLIEAAGRLAAEGRDFRLFIVGAEEEVTIEELRALGRRLGIEERLVFTGHVEDPLFYAAAFDFGVIPSLGSEAISRSALEFMAVGVPVVASLVGILPEVVSEDELLVPPGRPDSLAETLGRLLDDLPHAGRLGERAFRRVQRHFSLERLGEALEQLLEETPARPRAAQRAHAGTHE